MARRPRTRRAGRVAFLALASAAAPQRSSLFRLQSQRLSCAGSFGDERRRLGTLRIAPRPEAPRSRALRPQRGAAPGRLGGRHRQLRQGLLSASTARSRSCSPPPNRRCRGLGAARARSTARLVPNGKVYRYATLGWQATVWFGPRADLHLAAAGDQARGTCWSPPAPKGKLFRVTAAQDAKPGAGPGKGEVCGTPATPRALARGAAGGHCSRHCLAREASRGSAGSQLDPGYPEGRRPHSVSTPSSPRWSPSPSEPTAPPGRGSGPPRPARCADGPAGHGAAAKEEPTSRGNGATRVGRRVTVEVGAPGTAGQPVGTSPARLRRPALGDPAIDPGGVTTVAACRTRRCTRCCGG